MSGRAWTVLAAATFAGAAVAFGARAFARNREEDSFLRELTSEEPRIERLNVLASNLPSSIDQEAWKTMRKEWESAQKEGGTAEERVFAWLVYLATMETQAQVALGIPLARARVAGSRRSIWFNVAARRGYYDQAKSANALVEEGI